MNSLQKSSQEQKALQMTNTKETSLKDLSRNLPANANINAGALLEEYQSKEIRKVENPSQSLLIPGPTMRQIKDHKSEDFMLAFLEALILQTQDFLGSAKPMSETQIKITAQMMMDDYPHFKISDLRGIFNRIMKGRVKIYGSMTGTTIITACEEWHNDRCDIAAMNSQNQRETPNTQRTGPTSMKELHHNIKVKQFKKDNTK